MKKRELKDYNRLLKMESEDLWELLLMAENNLSDARRCGEIKLLQEENDGLVKDLNDMQADWAADHAEYRKTKPQLDPDFINEGFALTFNSELEYWSFMELCWGANLEWAITGDPRKSRPKKLFLMAHAVSCMDGHLEFATPVYYERELGYEIIKASDYLGVYQ